MTDVDRHYDWETEAARAAAIVTMAKGFIGEEKEDIVSDIDATGSIEDVSIRIRKAIDPFFLRVDNPEDVRVSADLAEEEKRLPRGDFGDFCPVTYVSDGFLAKGNPELEATVHGKTYVFAGEKELEEFKVDPAKFLVAQAGHAPLPLQPPAPKVMILGMKGAGITTQINMLCAKYKLQPFNLKDEFLARMKTEKEVRKRRRLLDRGFRAPPADQDPEEPWVDVEIEEDPEDFDKEAHERELLKMILDSSKGLVIDGTWNGFPEEAVTATDGAGYANLLTESRRAPELVVVLKCKEAAAFERLIDAEATKAEYERLEQERLDKRAAERAKDRAAKLVEVQEALKEETDPNTGEEMTPAAREAAAAEEMTKWDAEQK